MDFKTVEKKYRPIPFWSWNERLETDETRRQVRLMDKAGIGGYFMHARGGLATEYMSDEWFENVSAAISEGDSLGMYSWAYDENGWPSGFGGGAVNGLGVKYQQKWLDLEPASEGCDTLPETLLIKGGYRYFYRVNPLYVDNLDPEVVRAFIESTHEKYHARFPHSFEGFFTDEPQVGRGGKYHWSFILEEKFKERYGYSLIQNLDALFFEVEGYEQVRIDYNHLLTDLFSESFFKQIYEWCDTHGYKQTGHLVCEEDLQLQVLTNGTCMPHYEFFHIPGMDWLGRNIFDNLSHIQLGSAAAQFGKKQVLSETYALCGHNVSFAHLKRIYEWQMVRGVNLLCTHLDGYSLRGIRKRDYPPAMYYQQPWWEDVDLFFDSVSRIGKLLSEGEIVADTLLIHPIVSSWVAYSGQGEFVKNETIERQNATLNSEIRALEEKHVLFHLGDEVVMERHARVEDGKLIIGKMSYKTVVMPTHDRLLPSTERLLSEFRAQGGKIISVTEVEENPILPKSPATYTMRRYPDFDVHYIVNSTTESVDVKTPVGNKRLVIESGETEPFFGEVTLAPFDSIVIIDDHAPRAEKPEEKKLTELSLLGEWEVKGSTYNSITLDRCAYSFDGEVINEQGYVLDIIPRLCEIRQPVRVEQIFTFECDEIADEMFLATETPEIFEIELNGKQIFTKDVGFFRDSAIRLLPIRDAVKVGKNTLTLKSTIAQSEECYKHLDSSWEFETMKNCLSYDMELEPIYIVGNFGARLSSVDEYLVENEVVPARDTARPRYEMLIGDAYRTGSVPIITVFPKTVDISRLDECGFPEFSGELTLRRKFTVEDTSRFVALLGRGVSAVRLSVNGKPVCRKMWPPYEVDISDFLVEGENEIEITVVNNLRNMMGPHHLKEGESVFVTPGSFFRESNVFAPLSGAGGDCHDVRPEWDDNYCLVHFGF